MWRDAVMLSSSVFTAQGVQRAGQASNRNIIKCY